MKSTKWAAWLVLALVLFIVGLACQSSDRILNVAFAPPTPTRTRTLRPTFTPFPTATDTPTSTATPIPPTRTATRRPTPRPTPKPPPTAIPVVVPTAFPYKYHAYYDHCEHSGNAWIKGAVVWKKSDPYNTRLTGIKLRLSTSPDGGSIVDVYSIDDFAFVLSGVGEGSRPGTYFVWVIDEAGNRISEMSAPININSLPETNPASCWGAIVGFWETD